MLILEAALLILGLASLFIAGLLRTDPTIPATLLFASLVFFVFERWLRGALSGRRRSKERRAWEKMEAWAARKRSEELVDIESLFGNQ
jgi:peptidoglycan/LPS O-acetylase OafA/YrhL